LVVDDPVIHSHLRKSLSFSKMPVVGAASDMMFNELG
jgi:hypothetical protein